MSENSNPQPDLASQFRELGENLKTMIQSAWESDEALQFKEELKSGLTELGDAATKAVEDFTVSDAGQRFKEEANDFKARVESGEFEVKTREEISKALSAFNKELQKAIESFSKPDSEQEE
jgi:hypothetical protein